MRANAALVSRSGKASTFLALSSHWKILIHLTATLLRAVERPQRPVGAKPTRPLSLRPEAVGAGVEVTKRLKPLTKGPYRGSASTQALTKVNARQASKERVVEPT